MTLAERVRAAARRLEDAGLPADDSRRDAVLLARAVLGWSAADWLTRQHTPAPIGFDEPFQAFIGRRAAHEPIAYITGEREFYGRPFRVTPDVLIPRPETELLVEEALAEIAARGPGASPPRVVDVGTGSGCVAVTLALEAPATRVIGTDVSERALAVARANAASLDARVELCHGGLLASVSGPIDILVSNPPYVSEAERPTLSAEVGRYEPGTALFAGLDGLDVIRALLPDAARTLVPGGVLVVEIGAGQAPAVTRLVSATPGLHLVRIRADLQGIPRIVVSRRDRGTVAR